MNRDELVRARSEGWRRLSDLLRRADGPSGLRSLEPQEIEEVSVLYRSLAGDLMRTRRDKLGADLEQHLDGLAARAHNGLYAGSDVGQHMRPLDLLADGAPAIRRNWRFFFLATLLFYLPMLLAAFAAHQDESYALAILPEDSLEQFESMYRSADPARRNLDTDAQMTGFYVWNNVSIAFRCFATGVLFGLGSMFYLLFNGLFMGVVVGHLIRVGLQESILSFISSHSPWELTAIVISGGAGLQMGFALVSTHGRTRLGNLQAHGLELLRQVMIAAFFLVIAALIEGNVSPSPLPAESKYVIGALGWALISLIIAFAGAARKTPQDVGLLSAREAHR